MGAVKIQVNLIVLNTLEGFRVRLVWYVSLGIIMLEEVVHNVQDVYYVRNHFYVRHNVLRDLLRLIMLVYNFKESNMYMLLG